MSIAPVRLRTAVTTRRAELLLRVAEKRHAASGVVAVELEDPEGHRLPDWAPGAHIDLTVAEGLTRQYSLCGDRFDSTRYRIGVLREPASRGGSAYVHDRLRVGDTVVVGGPRNNFPLVPAQAYLFIAGGIGITPILAMIAQADMLGADWRLLYGGRTRASMAFLDELEAHGSRVRVAPQDTHGLLDLATAVEARPDGSRVYVCGPGPLLDAVGALTTTWPTGVLRTERFVADTRALVRATSFEVELARTGRKLTVEPDVSVLDAVARAGVTVLSSCRQGVCGTCETGVLQGRPDHRDTLLDDAERAAGDRMLICVSRSCDDRLVLDL